MIFEILSYELILLIAVSLVLLTVIFKSKGVHELFIFFLGLLLVSLSRAYIFFQSEALMPVFYVTTAVGYFLIAYSVVKLADYLRSVKVLEHTAFYDPLTKAYNRNFIEEYIKEEMKKARRLKQEFCVLLIDLNDFKEVNDRYGHNAGDVVLKRIVEELRRNLREYDMIARWGGDEFLVVLPAEEGCNILEIVGRLVEIKVEYGNVVVTLGVGYACFPQDGNTLDELIEMADSRMYRSKKYFKEAKKYAVDDKGEEEV
ncbi:MAG: GGDEF domain-containing protein [Aquificota bacterium]|nr:GGDEF domain-containing protein [Aquificota bacterium]MDQ7083211.1 GGDEF domain-containing protein [Aquificota bacterium]